MDEQQYTRGYGSNDLPSVFDICTPRKDIRDGYVESELAADLARVAKGDATSEYVDPAKFFAGTYPTKGIRDLLHHVLTRLSGNSSSAIFWLNTSFGGGKTHALIALLHASRSPSPDVVSEFVDTKLLPKEHVRIVVFDGQNADISNGHEIGDGIRAHTPWGEIAYGLAGTAGYARVDDSIYSSSPGADTIKELLGDKPVLVLLDELAVYLRNAGDNERVRKRFVVFLTALIKAVEGSPQAALVYTLAAGGDGDAYADENRYILGELESVSSRKATLLNPTVKGETIQILRRRLFERRNESQVNIIVDAYRRAWRANRDKLSDVVDQPNTINEFKTGYPLHPDILNTLISKTSTLENFQRVRGMLRILGHVVHNLWQHKDNIKPTAIHLHHFDIGDENLRLEITSKLKQDIFAAAIDSDIACDYKNKTSVAQKLDRKHYPNMPSFTTYVARVIFMNTLAYNQRLKGIDIRDLRYSVLWPDLDIGYIDEARNRFVDKSLYLNDNREKPDQFQAAPNIGLAIQREEQCLDDSDLEKEIDQRIENMFQQGSFTLCLFPAGHEDIRDDTDKPKLIIPKYAHMATSNPESTISMVDDIFRYKGIGNGTRIYRNNLIFLAAFESGVRTVYETARRYLAVSNLAKPESITNFADYQQKDIQKRVTLSNVVLHAAILKCYKYLYYPIQGDTLGYATMDWKENGGQRDIINKLRDSQKIRTNQDKPDNPESLVAIISELKNGEITTLDFLNEFYRNTSLPILIDDRIFIDGIRLGINNGVFVYKNGDLLCGKGDPECDISIDKNSIVYTEKKARKLNIWPRKPKNNDRSSSNNSGNNNNNNKFSLSSVHAEGKPSSAVRDILDKLHKNNISHITKIQIKSKDNIFPLLSVAGRIKEVNVHLNIEGDYKTDTGSRFNFDFSGTLKDSEPVREFLKPHLQESSIGNICVKLDIKFNNNTNADWLETLASSLRFVQNNVEIFGIEATAA